MIRAGSLEEADKAFRLLYQSESGLPQDEDHLVLAGRLLKARALTASGAERKQLFRQSADAYLDAHLNTGGTYSCINAATLFYIVGARRQAGDLARDTIVRCQRNIPQTAKDQYYALATLAEAQFLLGAFQEAEDHLRQAIATNPDDHDAIASTLHQFDLIHRETAHSTKWLDPFRLPGAIVFAGNIWEDDIDPGIEARIRTDVAATLHGDDRLLFSQAFGALAAGADILIAETLLDHDIALHVIAPCPDPLFRDSSVAPFGPAWLQRYDDVLARAQSVTHVTQNTDHTDMLDRKLGSMIAMGRARQFADRYATAAVQVLIFADHPDRKLSQTHQDRLLWQATGGQTVTLNGPKHKKLAAGTPSDLGADRSLHSMIFADVTGYGRLTESQIITFMQSVQPGLVSAYQGLDVQPDIANSWGDGIFLVYPDTLSAAHAAFALREAFQAIDLTAEGLPRDLSLRVAAHYGPAIAGTDPVTNNANVFGTEVVFAARIEPVTQPGSIYVSETFDAALRLTPGHPYRGEPAGTKVLRTGRAAIHLFSLHRRSQ